MNDLKAVVLAAGKGTRLSTDDTDVPKVMRLANGKPLLGYVLDAISFIDKKDIILVVGYKKESITESFDGYSYAVQAEQLGTGHAVMAAREKLENHTGTLLLCYGDMPLVQRAAYEKLLETHINENNDCTILSSESDLAMSFGRIERDENGEFVHVVEEKDCTPEQLKITELNTGLYVFDTQKLLLALEKLKNNNAQGEYYITDAPAIMKKNGAKIGIYKGNLGDDIIGVNTTEHLELVEEKLKQR